MLTEADNLFVKHRSELIDSLGVDHEIGIKAAIKYSGGNLNLKETLLNWRWSNSEVLLNERREALKEISLSEIIRG